MIKALKRMLTVALTLSFISLGGVLPADADNSTLKTFGNEVTFSSQKEKLIAEDSVIMRVDNRDYIVSNHRRALADGFERLRPYIKNNVVLIPVQSLLEGFGLEFEKGEDYITLISEDIKRQMQEQMSADDMICYWLNDEIEELNFEKITEDTSFYLNEKNNVVINFDEGDVAPMYMGSVEFEISPEVLSNIRKR